MLKSEAYTQVIAHVKKTGQGRERTAMALGISPARVGHYLCEARMKGELKYRSPGNSRLFEETGKAKSPSNPKSVDTVWSETSAGKAEATTPRSANIQTLEDAIAFHKIDTKKWTISRHVVNSWEVTTGASGDKPPATYTNFQVKLWLEKSVPDPFQVAVDNIVKRIGKGLPTFSPPHIKKNVDLHMAEIGLYDHHFGMLAWEPETGNNYDTKIAEDLYIDAVQKMLSLTSGFPIGKVLFPVGNDFFHLNDPSFMTPKGNNRLDVEGRLPKVFEAGLMACIKAITMCNEIAPVEVVWVSGNHDPQTSYYLCKVLEAEFKNTTTVSVDVTPRKRKIRVWGDSLVGLTHGELKWDHLPTLMATEWPQEWAASDFREWHVGHLHKSKETRYNVADTYGGIPVRVLPSLCASDAWHYEAGFVRATRSAEIHLWGKKTGKVGHFITHIK